MTEPIRRAQKRPARSAIFAEGIITVRPETPAAFEKFVDAYLTFEQPLLLRSGIDIAGSWIRTGSSTNQLMQIYRFDTLTTLEACGRAMFADPDFAALGGLYAWMDTETRYRRQLGIPLPFCPITNLDALTAEEPASARRYVEMRQRVLWGRRAEGIELLGRRVASLAANTGFRVAFAYEIEYGGAFGEVAIIGALADGSPAPAELLKAADAETEARLAEIVTDATIHELTPTGHSALR